MKVLSAGGGSGGHVTPVLAVLEELNQLYRGEVQARFVCDRSFAQQSRKLMAKASFTVPVHIIAAGKVRRYHGISWFRQVLDLPTLLLNVRDVFLIVLGTAQSIWLMLRWRPDVVFAKGGFVCVPVGCAARLLRIPIVMHDSDTHPGLASRIVSRWAKKIATGSPPEYYSYPPDKTHYVGVPVAAAFHPHSASERRRARKNLGLADVDRPLVVVTGGGLGSRKINDAIVAISDVLITTYGATILHISGKGNYRKLKARIGDKSHYRLVPFVDSGMAPVLAAADIVVTRAGATTMLELAAVETATVIVPHPHLTGGHQLKNAAMYADAGAARVIHESALASDPDLLLSVLGELLSDAGERRRLGKALRAFARPHAATDVAKLILEVAGK